VSENSEADNGRSKVWSAATLLCGGLLPTVRKRGTDDRGSVVGPRTRLMGRDSYVRVGGTQAWLEESPPGTVDSMGRMLERWRKAFFLICGPMECGPMAPSVGTPSTQKVDKGTGRCWVVSASGESPRPHSQKRYPRCVCV